MTKELEDFVLIPVPIGKAAEIRESLKKSSRVWNGLITQANLKWEVVPSPDADPQDLPTEVEGIHLRYELAIPSIPAIKDGEEFFLPLSALQQIGREVTVDLRPQSFVTKGLPSLSPVHV